MDEMDDFEEPGYDLKDLQEIGRKWIDRIHARQQAEEDWCKDAEAAEIAYLANEKAESAANGWEVPEFNILHSNVETIVPSIYNSTPSPDIRPRHNTQDPVAKAVADIIERAIATQIDDDALDTEIEATAQDVFVAGRGITRVKFNADEVPVQQMDPMTGQIFETIQIANERVEYENVAWKDYVFGPCKRHKNRPWEAFRHCISQEELEEITDDEVGDVYARGDTPTEKEELDVDVWEIWCKETRRVYFIVESSAKVVSIKEDPLGLSDFFTVPNIIQPIKATSSTLPVCPYKIYRVLAEEMDTATRRINGIMKGLKVRGVIAGDSEIAELLAELGDNELVPVPNIENLVAAGGLDKAIMWWPIGTAIAVLQQLYVQREQTKQAIYEITGISDIIRGQGAASETATAQQIKTQWGSLRIKKMQRLIERHVRDLFKLSAEIISLHFSLPTMQKISGVQIDPQMAQLLQKPFDHYRIDVESDSTVRADLTKGRAEMAEFLQGTGQFFNTMAPIVAQAPQAAGPIVEMYASFARQFNLGKQAEDALEQFAEMAKAASQEQRPDPQAEAMKAEMEMKAKEMEGKFMLEVEKLKLQAQNLQLDGQLKQADLALKQGDLALQGDRLKLDEAKAEVDAVARAVEIEMEQEQERPVKVGND